MPTNNPIIDGIMDGLLIREHMAKMTQDQGDYEHRMAADQRAQQEFENNIVQQRWQHQHQQTQDQLQDINTRLALGTNPGLIQVQPGEDTRTVQLPLDETMQKAYGGIPALSMSVPIDNTVEYGGRRYAMRSAEELEADKMRDLNATSALKLKDTLAAKSLEQQMNQVYVPGIGYVDKSVAPSFINSASREKEGAANRTNAVTVANIRGSATRDTAARRDQLTPSGVESVQSNIRRDLAAQERAEAPLEQLRQRIKAKGDGKALNYTTFDRDGLPATVSLTSEEATQRLGEVENSLAGIRKKKAQIYQRMLNHGFITSDDYERMVGDLGLPPEQKTPSPAPQSHAPTAAPTPAPTPAPKPAAAPAANRPASAASTARPPQAALDAIPPGQTATFRNGQVWTKNAAGQVTQIQPQAQ